MKTAFTPGPWVAGFTDSRKTQACVMRAKDKDGFTPWVCHIQTANVEMANANARQMALDLLEAMQADMGKYLLPSNGCGPDWFVNRMLWHLDGPQQREAQAALESELAAPSNVLHDAIMNLPCSTAANRYPANELMAYKLGHRDARHAAAELAIAKAAA